MDNNLLQDYKHPEAAAAAHLQAAEAKKKVAQRVPDLTKFVLIGIAFQLFSVFGLWFIFSDTFGETEKSTLEQLGDVLSPVDIFVQLAGFIMLIALLNVRSIKLAKYMVLIIGAAFTYSLITSLMSFSVFGVALNGYILYRIYLIYEDIDGLGYKL